MKHKRDAEVASEACSSRLAENEAASETLREALAHSTAEARRCKVGIEGISDILLGTVR